MKRNLLQIYIPILIRETNNSQIDFYAYYYMFILYLFLNKPAHGEVYSIQHDVIKLVSDLIQVDDFLQFLPQIKLTATI